MDGVIVAKEKQKAALDYKKVPVSTRALMQRINRKLREDDRVVKATRGPRAFLAFGDYYMLDRNRGLPVEGKINLEKLGRDLGVLHAHEEWDTSESEQ